MATHYFEDFDIGHRWTFDPWEVTREDVVAFATEYDPQPLHTDEHAASATPFGGLIASGWQTTLKCITPFIVHVMSKTAGLASPGLENIRWIAPVRPGDLITPCTEVIDAVPSKSKPDRGRVHFEFSGQGRDGATVMSTRGCSSSSAAAEIVEWLTMNRRT